jgi:hypothetical protein
MTPKEMRTFLNSVSTLYQTIRSYRDLGSVCAWSERSRVVEHFSTQIVRPDRFRFDYLSPLPMNGKEGDSIYHGIVMAGSRVTSYSRIPSASAERDKELSLADAISRVTGETLGAAYHVPRLLLKEIPGVPLIDYEDWRSEDDAVIAGIQCRQLSCNGPVGRCLVAFDRDALLIRRITTKTPTFQSQETRSEIQVNAPIDNDVFEEPFVESLMSHES